MCAIGVRPLYVHGLYLLNQERARGGGVVSDHEVSYHLLY